MTPEVDANDSNDEKKKSSFIEHIKELRKVFIHCIGAILLGSIVCGLYWKEIFSFISILPLRLSDPMPRLIYTAPTESITLAFRIAITCGLIIVSPYIFYQIWSFVAPGLYKKEKKIILPIVLVSTICFLSGIVYCYYLLPLLLQFLTAFAGEDIEPYFRISEYLSFLLKTCIAFGIAFELPVVAVLLARMGIIDYKFLLKYFRGAIVIIFIVAAILTPPDVLSQLFLALPLLLLYGISIVLVYLVRKKEIKCETE